MIPWDKFNKLNKESGLIKSGDRVMAAVSGGPDSVALLHLLWRLKKNLPFQLYALAMNHGLRKAASNEIKLVQRLGEKLGVPVITENLPVLAHAKRTRQSIETTARELRYSAFARFAKMHNINKIATGHTASDTAETMLMWLLRGTGTAGLAGIPLRRALNGAKDVAIIRPILSLTRRDVVAYCASQHLNYAIDKSNLSLEYTRNRIRHKVMPLMEKLNARFVEHCFTLSQIVAGEHEYLSGLSDAAYKACVTTKKDSSIILDLRRFILYNKQVRDRVLKKLLPAHKTTQTITRLSRFIDDKGACTLLVAANCKAIKRSAKVVIQPYNIKQH
jgi:tRNA(Ile)-lysidine synthase